MKTDPCDRCVLPDCDDTDRRCVLRQLSNRYQRRPAGEKHLATVDEREAYNTLFMAWRMERQAQLSENSEGQSG